MLRICLLLTLVAKISKTDSSLTATPKFSKLLFSPQHLICKIVSDKGFRTMMADLFQIYLDKDTLE